MYDREGATPSAGIYFMPKLVKIWVVHLALYFQSSSGHSTGKKHGKNQV
jgi:hypothetical protein